MDNCRVLIVEDNAAMARLLDLALKPKGYEMQTTRNGTEALMLAARFRPHIVLVDIGLPGLDGLHVARELRKTHPEILIVAVTGRSSPEDIEQSRAAGCDHHLTKPFDLRALDELLEIWQRRSGCAT